MRTSATWQVALLGLALAACKGGAGSPAEANSPSSSTSQKEPQESGQPLAKLKIEDVKPGTGEPAVSGDQLSVVYTGTTKNGKVFDSNDKPDGQPFKFMLGAGSVIKGWDQGLVGMKPGGERKLSIPSDLAYGSEAKGENIPPNSDLYFDIKLKHVTKRSDEGTILSNDKKKGSGPALKNGDTAVITYTVTDEDGAVKDENFAKKTYSFKVGVGAVQPGIDVGILGMKKGGERILQIPGGMGLHGPAYIPGSTFTVDIHLVDVKHP